MNQAALAKTDEAITALEKARDLYVADKFGKVYVPLHGATPGIIQTDLGVRTANDIIDNIKKYKLVLAKKP